MTSDVVPVVAPMPQQGLGSDMYNTDRRAFLAMAPALAVITAGLGTTNNLKAELTAWDAAMQAYVAAELRCDRFQKDVYEPLNGQEEAFYRSHGAPSGSPGWLEKQAALDKQYSGHKVSDSIEVEFERLAGIAYDAKRDLMATPAPNMAALHWKLDQVFEMDGLEDSHTPGWSFNYVKQTIADYKRLLGGL